jgi:hypothetical protein
MGGVWVSNYEAHYHLSSCQPQNNKRTWTRVMYLSKKNIYIYIYIGARLHYHPPQFHAHKKHTVNTIQNCFFRMLSCEHAYCFFVLIHFGDTVMSMWLYLYRMYASSKEPLRFPQRRAMFDKVQTVKLHFVLGFTAYFALWQVHASHGIKHCLAACPYKASNPW